jgi:methionine-rich copper-binding protein CopC
MLGRVSSLLALALLTLLVLPAVALAHADLVSSEPPDGGTISRPPYTLTAVFSEDLDAERSRIVVRDAAGTEVARGGVGGGDTSVMVVDLAGVAPGDYVARWTAVTPEDDGVTRGNIEFTIAQPPSPTPSPTASPTLGPTGSAAPTPTTSPSAPPTPSPSPSPSDGVPSGGPGDLLIALAVAGLLVAGLAAYLWRRRGA